MNRNLQLAYLAGLIDGEGCFSVSSSEGKVKARLEVSMTDAGVIKWAHDTFGGTTFKQERRAAWEEIHTWRLSKREELRKLTEELLPFFRTKRLAAIIVLEFCTKFPSPPKGYSLPEETKQEMQKYCDFISVANGRGRGSAERKVEFLRLLEGGAA